MIRLSNTRNFRSAEVSKLQVALNLVNTALKDPRFQNQIKCSKFDNTSDTGEEVFAKISKDGAVSSISIATLSWWANHVNHTIAYENPDGTIVLNRYFFQDQSLASLANTLIHEWCHACGYSHSSASDSGSVPYWVGTMLEDYLTAKELLGAT